jgi:hypothetical protein
LKNDWNYVSVFDSKGKLSLKQRFDTLKEFCYWIEININKNQATVTRYENHIKKKNLLNNDAYHFKIFIKIETEATEQTYSVFSDVIGYTKNEIVSDYVFEFKFNTSQAGTEIFHLYYNKKYSNASISGLDNPNKYRNEQKIILNDNFKTIGVFKNTLYEIVKIKGNSRCSLKKKDSYCNYFSNYTIMLNKGDSKLHSYHYNHSECKAIYLDLYDYFDGCEQISFIKTTKITKPSVIETTTTTSSTFITTSTTTFSNFITTSTTTSSTFITTSTTTYSTDKISKTIFSTSATVGTRLTTNTTISSTAKSSTKSTTKTTRKKFTTTTTIYSTVNKSALTTDLTRSTLTKTTSPKKPVIITSTKTNASTTKTTTKSSLTTIISTENSTDVTSIVITANATKNISIKIATITNITINNNTQMHENSPIKESKNVNLILAVTLILSSALIFLMFFLYKNRRTIRHRLIEMHLNNKYFKRSKN